MNHQRRKVVHFNITDSPSAAWNAQQIVNAFPYDTATKYLLRDRDSIYGSIFVHRVEGMGIQQKLTAPRSPWQNPFAERLIGSIRRECLDRVIVLNEQQLRKILTDYFAYYFSQGIHQSFDTLVSLAHHRTRSDGYIPRPDGFFATHRLQDYFNWLGRPYYLALQSAASLFGSNPQAAE